MCVCMWTDSVPVITRCSDETSQMCSRDQNEGLTIGVVWSLLSPHVNKYDDYIVWKLVSDTGVIFLYELPLVFATLSHALIDSPDVTISDLWSVLNQSLTELHPEVSFLFCPSIWQTDSCPADPPITMMMSRDTRAMVLINHPLLSRSWPHGAPQPINHVMHFQI